MGKKQQPLDNLQWVNREKLTANDYNPNVVAPPELRLLKRSILEDGWTQPIVINSDYSIVDGFHRWTVSESKEIYNLTGGLVPVVMLSDKALADKKMATIRHNRARGTHTVVNMSNIICSMLEEGIEVPEVMKRLGMEREEVIRLAARNGIAKSDIFGETEFGKAWKPK